MANNQKYKVGQKVIVITDAICECFPSIDYFYSWIGGKVVTIRTYIKDFDVYTIEEDVDEMWYNDFEFREIPENSIFSNEVGG